MVKPYIELSDKMRVFPNDIPEEELVWHRDEENRIIRVVNGVGWQFQYENNLPFELEVGEILFIPKMMYHRIYKKGNNNLIIEIVKNDGNDDG